jgi:hypothetical protein
MPTYDIRNKETGEEKEVIMSYDAVKALTNAGEWEQIHKSTAMIVTHQGNILSKTSGDWRDLLKRVKKGSGRGCNINTY